MKTHTLVLAAVLLMLLMVNAWATTRYVDLNSANPTPPYTNWATAARTIQDAVDAAEPGDQILVTNGVYQEGGRVIPTSVLTNRVAITKPVSVRSVNGPAVTIIRGNTEVVTNANSGIRCVYLTNGASLSGFTLLDGNNVLLRQSPTLPNVSGGALWCESSAATVSNCVLTGNYALRDGGGAYRGTLVNCVLANNMAESNGAGAAYCTLINCTLTNNRGGPLGLGVRYGGGAAYSTLNNCLVISNVALYGAGAAYCTLNNCTVVADHATTQGGGTYQSTNRLSIIYLNSRWTISGDVTNNYAGGEFKYCCTWPLPQGPGNLASAPQFVSWFTRNLRLQSNSPCINAGNNAYVTCATDLDGNPRIVGGTVDIGAYEFQLPSSVLSYAWAQQYGLPTDGSADFADPDGDGMNNWQEWRCDTNPTNALSVLKMLTPEYGASGIIVRWQSVTNRSYSLERSTDLGAQPPFQTLATNIPGQPDTTSYTDTNAVGPGPFFYRVGVEP